MKKIFCLRTYYQIIFALQMVNTICKDDEVVFLISDDSNGSKRVAEKIQSIGIVKKVIWIKTKRLTYEKNLFEKISDSISIALLETNRYENVLRPILNIGFDEFIFFNFGVDTIAFYNLFVKRNPDIKVSRIEEGILSYGIEIGYGQGKIVDLSYYVRKLLHRKNIIDNFYNFYCYYPVIYKGNLQSVQIPRISVNSKTARILGKIFRPDTSGYTQKYIFFTSVYDFEGGEPIGEYELVLKVANLVGKDNLLIKIHPRDLRTIYSDNGFNVDKNSLIPWEAIQLSSDFSDKVFLTINSGSVLSGSTMSEKPVKTFYMYKLCNIKENRSCQKNAQDIEALLCKSSMKEVFRNVKIAEKIEDIL